MELIGYENVNKTNPQFLIGSHFSEPLADTPCHARQRPEDHEKVQKYMRIKRKKTINERKAKVEAAAQEKAAVQQRLQALETWRRSQANESVEVI